VAAFFISWKRRRDLYRFWVKNAIVTDLAHRWRVCGGILAWATPPKRFILLDMDNLNAGLDRNTDMKLNPSSIRKLREERAWSQEHLAEVAGLSLRTVQRVESDGSASHDTRLALAAVFELDVSSLSVPSLNAQAPAACSEATAPAPASVEPNRLWIWRLARLGTIALFLVALDFFLNGRLVWAQWPLLGLSVVAVVISVRQLAWSRWIVVGFSALAAVALAFGFFRSGEAARWMLWVPVGFGFLVLMRWLRRKERQQA